MPILLYRKIEGPGTKSLEVHKKDIPPDHGGRGPHLSASRTRTSKSAKRRLVIDRLPLADILRESRIRTYTFAIGAYAMATLSSADNDRSRSSRHPKLSLASWAEGTRTPNLCLPGGSALPFGATGPYGPSWTRTTLWATVLWTYHLNTPRPRRWD